MAARSDDEGALVGYSEVSWLPIMMSRRGEADTDDGILSGALRIQQKSLQNPYGVSEIASWSRQTAAQNGYSELLELTGR